MSTKESFALICLIASVVLFLGWFIVAARTLTRRAPRGPDTETNWSFILGKLYGSFWLVTMLAIFLIFSSYALYES